MRHEEYGHAHWKAEDIAAFMRDKTGVHVEKVERPSFSRSGWFPVLVLAILLAGWPLLFCMDSYSTACRQTLLGWKLQPYSWHSLIWEFTRPKVARWHTTCTTRPS